MFLRKLLAATVAMTITAGCAARASDNPVQKDPAPNVIPLYLSSERAIIILRVGDAPPVPVLFDTGTTDNVLDAHVASFLGLKRKGPAHVIDAATGKPAPGYLADMPDARASDVAVRNSEVEVINFPEPDAAGSFGPNTFSGDLVELQFGRSRIVLVPKSVANIPATPAQPYLGAGDEILPAVRMQLPGGKEVVAHLDTGNDGDLQLPLDLASKLPLAAKPRLIGKLVGAGGEQPVYRAQLEGEVVVGPVTLHRPQIDFVQGGGAAVGLGVLRRMTVVLDPQEHRSWVLP